MLTAVWSELIPQPYVYPWVLTPLGVLHALRWNDSPAPWDTPPPPLLGMLSCPQTKKTNLLSTRKCIHKCVHACMCLKLGVVRTDFSWVRRSFDWLHFLKVSGWSSEFHVSETAAHTQRTSEDDLALKELSKYISTNVNRIFREKYLWI